MSNTDELAAHHAAGAAISDAGRRWKKQADMLFRCFSIRPVLWDVLNDLPGANLLEHLRQLLGIYTAGSAVREADPFAEFLKVAEGSGQQIIHEALREKISRAPVSRKREVTSFSKELNPATPVWVSQQKSPLPFQKMKNAILEKVSTGGDQRKEKKAMPLLRPHMSLPRATHIWESGIKPIHHFNRDLHKWTDDPLQIQRTEAVAGLLPFLSVNREKRHSVEKSSAAFSANDLFLNEIVTVPKTNFRQPDFITDKDYSSGGEAYGKEAKKKSFKNLKESQAPQLSGRHGGQLLPPVLKSPQNAPQKEAFENRSFSEINVPPPSEGNRNELAEKIIEIQKAKQHRKKKRRLKKASSLKNDRISSFSPAAKFFEQLADSSSFQKIWDQYTKSFNPIFLREWESQRLGNKHLSYHHPSTFSQEDIPFPPSSEGKDINAKTREAYSKPLDSRSLRNRVTKTVRTESTHDLGKGEVSKPSLDPMIKTGETRHRTMLLESLVNIYWSRTEKQLNRDIKMDFSESDASSTTSAPLIPSKREHFVFERNNNFGQNTNSISIKEESGESPESLSRKVEEALIEQARRYGIDL